MQPCAIRTSDGPDLMAAAPWEYAHICPDGEMSRFRGHIVLKKLPEDSH